MAAAQAGRRSRGPDLHPHRARRRVRVDHRGGGPAISLRARLLGAAAYTLLLATIAFGVPLALSLRARINDEVSTQARAQADLIAATASDLLGRASRADLQGVVDKASNNLSARVLIVGAKGKVLVDSAGPAEVGSSYASRPELQAALNGTPDQRQRYSKTLGEELLATAVPIVHNQRTAGAVRVTQSVQAVHDQVVRVELELAAIAAIVLLIGMLAGSVIARQISGPVRRLELVAGRLSRGDMSARAVVEGSREQRSLSRSFNEMADRIGRLVRAQKDFVADASHQLRTPLTGLRLRLEGARAITEDESVAHELDEALGEVDRLSGTVSELLLLSNAGERQADAHEVDLAEVAELARTRWRTEAVDRGLSLAIVSAQEPGSVWAARADIDRALDALIENALHYSPAGTEVTLALSEHRIEVRDRGPGIAPEERELVFERFRRGRAGRTGEQGHGLGLPIARELARAWGGEVELVERPDGGTCAVLDFGGDGVGAPPVGEDFASA